MFKASIGNLAPGKSCELTISYVTQLSHNLDRVVLTIPKSIMPNSSELVGWLGGDNKVTLRDFALEAIIDMPSPIMGLDSPTYPVKMDFEDCHATVTVNKTPVCPPPYNTTPNTLWHNTDNLHLICFFKAAKLEDFQLLIRQKDGGKGRGWVEVSEGKPSAAMVCMYPSFNHRIVPEIIFLVDRSGKLFSFFKYFFVSLFVFLSLFLLHWFVDWLFSCY